MKGDGTSAVLNPVSVLERTAGNTHRPQPCPSISHKYTSLYKEKKKSVASHVTFISTFFSFSLDFCSFIVSFFFAHLWFLQIFLIHGDQRRHSGAWVRATTNQTWPQEACDGTELDRLQRETNWRGYYFILTLHDLLWQLLKIHNKRRYSKKNKTKHRITNNDAE